MHVKGKEIEVKWKKEKGYAGSVYTSRVYKGTSTHTHTLAWQV
jgi:hypothetical protein